MAKKTKNSIRVCYVLCYRDPNYIRSQVLLEAFRKIDGVELIVVKNRHRGFLRYGEVPLRLLYTRLRYRPDIFIVGFRGHEVFWMLYPGMAGKKIIFDEFVNLHDWMVSEHGKLKEDSLPIKLMDGYVKWIIRKSDMVLSDTAAHVRLSQRIYGTPAGKLAAIPISADEKVFYPRPAKRPKRGRFEIFFFGSMLPLHGMDHILKAIEMLQAKNQLGDMHFTFAGGKGNQAFISQMKQFVRRNKLAKHVNHILWVPYDELPAYIAAADLCIGGPFGNTGQARRVITGKTYQFLAMGRPTLIGKLEIPTGFKDKQNCLLVDQASAVQIAEAIHWAATHPKELAAISRNGHEYYESHLSNDVISRQLQEILGSLT